MSKLTRQLLKLAKGGNEEWWRLVFDTEAQRLYIEHEWSHTDPWPASRSKSGTAEFDINGFLAEGEAPAQAELQRIIESLFENGGGENAKGPKSQKRPRSEQMMTTVVVFGGAGFLGRRLVHRLAPSFPERETSAIGTKQTNLMSSDQVSF
jgi:hypothetical protein